MKKTVKNRIFVIDTSVILSGKPIEFSDSEICTTINVQKEFSRAGRDQNNFLFLQEKGHNRSICIDGGAVVRSFSSSSATISRQSVFAGKADAVHVD